MNLKLINADMSHSRNAWMWRNDPITRYYSRNNRMISWEDHDSWFRQLITHSECYLYIGMTVSPCIKNSISMIRFDICSSSPKASEVSINIAPQARGKGYGRLLLEKGTTEFTKEIKRSFRVIAEVGSDNVTSTRLFRSGGYSWIKTNKKTLIDIFRI